MRARFLITTLVGLLAVGAFVGYATATPNTKVDLQQDCGVPCVEPIDSSGPTGFGFINYSTDENGDLRVVVSLKNAAPDTTYEIFLVCGPTHADVCGSITIGFLTTNGQGNGNTGTIVLTSPFQGGPDDHIDMLAGFGDLSAGVYIGTPITT